MEDAKILVLGNGQNFMQESFINFVDQSLTLTNSHQTQVCSFLYWILSNYFELILLILMVCFYQVEIIFFLQGLHFTSLLTFIKNYKKKII